MESPSSPPSVLRWIEDQGFVGIALREKVPVGMSRAHATWTTRRLPHALTYLRKVAIDGECFPVAKARSKRATAGAWVPMRSATCAWVRPASWRAFSRASSRPVSSRSMRSTSARTPGRRISFLTSCSCVCTFDLLHSGREIGVVMVLSTAVGAFRLRYELYQLRHSASVCRAPAWWAVPVYSSSSVTSPFTIAAISPRVDPAHRYVQTVSRRR